MVPHTTRNAHIYVVDIPWTFKYLGLFWRILVCDVLIVILKYQGAAQMLVGCEITDAFSDV